MTLLELPPPVLHTMITLRQSLHQYPELSNQEALTATRLQAFLERYNPSQILTEIGGWGLAAVFDSDQVETGPSVLFRADMDALLIEESNAIPYRSGHAGIAHKCGHDGHMAMVAGLAQLLAERPPQKGRVILFFQPAEETGEGALRSLQDPRLQNLQPDYVFALHNLPHYPLGQILLSRDPNQVFSAASTGCTLELHGASAHAAYPERGRSPALALAELIQHLQALNRECQAEKDFAMLTVVSAQLGDGSFGIAPGDGRVLTTLRAYDDQVLEQLCQQCQQLAQDLSQKHGLELKLSWCDAFPVTRNHSEATERIRQSALKAGCDVALLPEPLRWSEDFGWFTRQFKGAMFGLGAGDQVSLHSSDYDFPETILEPGLRVFYGLLEELGVNQFF